MFKEFYESVSWQLWETFDYLLMWQKRIERRRQRELNKKFDFKNK